MAETQLSGKALNLDPASFDSAQLAACGAGTLFRPDSPRLPTGQMLMFDRVTRISRQGGAHGRGEIVAELDVRPDLWFFGCHFTGDPVMPGCLGLDALWQLVGFFLAWQQHPGRGRALGVDEVRFFGQVLPSARLVSYRLDIRRVVTRKLIMAIADGEVRADDRPIYAAKGLRVGVFTDMGAFQEAGS